MRVRILYALAFAALFSLVATGCGSSSRPYAFGGNASGTGATSGNTNVPGLTPPPAATTTTH